MLDRIAEILNEIRTVIRRRRQYRQTVDELSHMSDAELADIGIHRCEISRIAMESTYDNLDPNPNVRGWV